MRKFHVFQSAAARFIWSACANISAVAASLIFCSVAMAGTCYTPETSLMLLPFTRQGNAWRCLNMHSNNANFANVAKRRTMTVGMLVRDSSATIKVTSPSVDVEHMTERAQVDTQHGELLDTFKDPTDADDTQSLVRATAKGVPIILGARTYHVADFATGPVSSFGLRGVKGRSIIQRIASNTPRFFNVAAKTVLIDGVTFDMNKSAVPAAQSGFVSDLSGQNIVIKNSVFKNSSGYGLSIISTGPHAGGSVQILDNEATNNVGRDIYLGSITSGEVRGNYVHDSAANGIVATANGKVSTTNFLSKVKIHGNTVARTNTGIVVGGYSPPYSFVEIPAQHVEIYENRLIDNRGYGAAYYGFDGSFKKNKIVQSTSAAKMVGAFDALAKRLIITGNTFESIGVPYGIDVGGSIYVTIRDNTLSMSGGSCFNVGGNAHSDVLDNHCSVKGASGVVVLATEGNGSPGGGFPTQASDIAIHNNTIKLIGAAAKGVQLLDNPGMATGKISIRKNNFMLASGAVAEQSIDWLGMYSAVEISDNEVNGSTVTAIDPDMLGNIVLDTVNFGTTITGASSTRNIAAFVPKTSLTYGRGGSILWVTPTAGGSGYSNATKLSASGTGGGSGWIGKPILNKNVIIGVSTTAYGSGYSGTVRVTASDSGGGSGATFSVGRLPQMPQSTLRYRNTRLHLLRTGSHVMPIYPPVPAWLQAGMSIHLTVQSPGLAWQLDDYPIGSFAFSNLPSCNANVTPAVIYVTGSALGKRQAHCDGTNWIYTDGTLVH